MNIKKIIFKQAARAITDAKYTGMGVHDGNARIQYYNLEWMMNRIEELEQQLQQAHREGWEQCRREASHICKEGIPTSWGVTSSRELSNAIAAMEYNESTNG